MTQATVCHMAQFVTHWGPPKRYSISIRRPLTYQGWIYAKIEKKSAENYSILSVVALTKYIYNFIVYLKRLFELLTFIHCRCLDQ